MNTDTAICDAECAASLRSNCVGAPLSSIPTLPEGFAEYLADSLPDWD